MKTSAEAASSTSRMVRAGEMIWSRRFTASMRKSALRLIRLRMGLDDGSVHGAKLRARRLEIDAGRQPAEELRHPVHPPVHHRRVEMVRARHDVGDDLGFLRIGHGGLEHADDGGGAIAQAGWPCR